MAAAVASPSETTTVGAASSPEVSFAQSMSWVSLEPPAPIAASGAGFAALPNSGEGLLFGGETMGGLVNNTTVYDEATNSWQSLSPIPAPSPRSDFALAADSTSAVLFGGLVDLSTQATANDTWVYQYGSMSWTNVSKSVAPAPREDPAFAIDPTAGVALLYGGWAPNPGGTGETIYSDVWELNLGTDIWTRVAVTGTGPGALRGASLVWQPALGVFLLFGGCYPCSSTVWSFAPTGTSWTEQAADGSVPSPRMGSVWVWDPAQGVDLLFGGTNGTTSFNDTYYYSPSDLVWTRASAGAAPPARWDSAADFLNATGNQTLLLSGGTDGGAPFADTWRLAAVADLLVQLTNKSSGLAIAYAIVDIGRSGYVTNATGFINATALPATETTVSSSVPGYETRAVSEWLTPGAESSLTLALTPLPPRRSRSR